MKNIYIKIKNVLRIVLVFFNVPYIKLRGKYYTLIGGDYYCAPSRRQLFILKEEILYGYSFYKDLFATLLGSEFDGYSILDIGGNIGYSSIKYQKSLGGSGAVYSFEPYKDNIECFNYNTRRYDNIFLLPFGCSDKIEPLLLGFPDYSLDVQDKDRRNNTGMITAVESCSSSMDKYTSLAITIDSILPVIDIENKVVYVKIDVEGFEKKVLGGATNILSSPYRCLIELEINSVYQDEFSYKDLLELAAANEYKIIIRKKTFDSVKQHGCRIFDVIIIPNELCVLDKLKSLDLVVIDSGFCSLDK